MAKPTLHDLASELDEYKRLKGRKRTEVSPRLPKSLEGKLLELERLATDTGLHDLAKRARDALEQYREEKVNS